MKPIFTSLTPNAEKDDILRSFALLTAPHLWAQGPSIPELEHTLRHFLGAHYVFSFDSGRTGLYAILKSLHLNPEAEVLLQAYTCVAVPDPVLWNKLTPVYVDIDPETLNMSADDLEKKITPRSKVLIIQHTFGFPADLDRLLHIARQHNLFIIEDCAHALGAHYHDKPVGSFGDAAFFSFGRDKVISSTFGGLVVTNHKDLALKIGHFEKSLHFPSGAWVIRQLLHPILMAKAKLLYRIGLGKLYLAIVKGLRLTSRAVYPREKSGGKPPFVFHRLSNALAFIAYKQFKKLEKFNVHRAKIAALYEKELSSFPVKRQSSIVNSHPIYLRYVVRHPRASEIIAAAKKHNIFLGDWYRQGIAPEGVDYKAVHYDPASCPNAESVANETINLPTDIHITEADAHRIIKFIKEWSGSESASTGLRREDS